MPIQYRIDVERGLVQTTASGVLTDEDVMQHKAALVQDPDFKPGMKEVSDIRHIERLAVTPEGVRAMVSRDESDAAKVASHRLAIVASADFVFGTARMYQSQTEGNLDEVNVFRSMDDALAWLQSA